jgi:hypothetical protein
MMMLEHSAVLKTSKGGNWSLKMALIPCVNIVHCLIFLKIFLFTVKSIMENLYSDGIDKISNFLKRFVHRFLDLVPAIITKIFLCKVNIILLLDELPPHSSSYLIME